MRRKYERQKEREREEKTEGKRQSDRGEETEGKRQRGETERRDRGEERKSDSGYSARLPLPLTKSLAQSAFSPACCQDVKYHPISEKITI